MDSLPSFSANALNTSTAPFQTSTTAIASHQLQQGAQQSQTLPPLQPTPVMQQHSYASYPQHSRAPTTSTSGTSSSSSSSGAMATYPPPAQNQSAGRNSYQMMGNSPYQQQQYPTTSAMLPQTTTAASLPQAIAPAPSTSINRPPGLRPTPSPGVMAQSGMNSPYAQSQLMPATTSMMPDGDTPTHVVGSQGRRGILPSAPGRPAAPQPGSGAKTQIPQKDADGKFPCPHCTKTYLHAKHLKRHLLRHTGDRPYMCVLCRDTFSRSDILKRHFIKCSVRRGNPTGASHLSHPQAHVKKNGQAQQKAMEGDVNHMNGMGGNHANHTNHADGMVPFGLMPSSDGMNNMSNDQSQLSRSSSMNRLEEANRDRRSMPAGNNFDTNYNGGNMPANMNTQMPGYSMPQGNLTGMPFPQQSSSTDWSQVFQAGAHHPHAQIDAPPNLGQNQIEGKQEPSMQLGAADNGNAIETIIPSWGAPTENLSYQYLSKKIGAFLQPSPPASPSCLLQTYFQPDNIRHFLGRYSLFHVHFPFIHIPTFCVLQGHPRLAAAMCCVGACYSHKIPAADVRDVMRMLKSALEKSSAMLATMSNERDSLQHSSAGPAFDLEELQSIILLLIMFCWHGTPTQREEGRRALPRLASLVRKAGFLELSQDDNGLLSVTHQPEFMLDCFEPSKFQWSSWVEQEKRVRTAYTVFLLDCTLGLYFNTTPTLDAMELCLPLPADDAAWDAVRQDACAEALGLCGPEISRLRNPDGTNRPTQPQLTEVLEALTDVSPFNQPSITNFTGKFLIMHGLLAMIRRLQLHRIDMVTAGMGRPGSRLADTRASETRELSDSRAATPVDRTGCLLEVVSRDTFVTALEKFKANWDYDMRKQFPQSAPTHPRRYGFFKDAIHFYWLARYVLKNTKQADLQLGPDQRFVSMSHVLRSIEPWVLADSDAEEVGMGSEGNVDLDAEVGSPYLDMTKVFRPLPRMVEALEGSNGLDGL